METESDFERQEMDQTYSERATFPEIYIKQIFEGIDIQPVYPTGRCIEFMNR